MSRRGTGDGFDVLPPPLNLAHHPWRMFTAARRIAALHRLRNFDVLHIIVEPYAMVVPFLPASLRRRIILTIHGSYGIRPLESACSRFIASRYYRQIPTFVTVSNYTKKRVMEELLHRNTRLKKTFENRAIVVRNGVHVPNTWHAHVPHTPFQILHVGGVKPRKGVLEAVEGCAAYCRLTGNNIRFVCIGSMNENDAYVQHVRRRIQDHSLEKAVNFVGQVDDEELAHHYETADIFLMPALTDANTFEGFGIVYIEANARGVPCIGPREGGAAEAIQEGISGYRVNPKNPAEIAQRMQWILDERKIDSAACRQWAEKHDIRQVAAQIETLYVKTVEQMQEIDS